MDLLIAFSLVLSVIALYWNSRHGEFVFDDDYLVNQADVYNQTGRLSTVDGKPMSTVFGWRRGLLFVTYEQDAAVHGRDPHGWHLTNIAIHAVNAVLVYALLRHWFDILPAAMGALIFAAHPLTTSAVASIAGRSSSLCAVFYLSCLLALLIGAWYIALPLGFLAWKCKEEALMLRRVRPFCCGDNDSGIVRIRYSGRNGFCVGLP